MAARTYSITNNWHAPISLPLAGSLRIRRINAGETVTDSFILTNRPHVLRWIRSKLITIVEPIEGQFFVFLVDDQDAYLVDEDGSYLVAA